MRPNLSIIGSTILPQAATKLTKICNPEFGALLWCNLTLQRKKGDWVHSYSLTRAQQPQRYFGIFITHVTFGAHNLLRSKPFFDCQCEL